MSVYFGGSWTHKTSAFVITCTLWQEYTFEFAEWDNVKGGLQVCLD